MPHSHSVGVLYWVREDGYLLWEKSDPLEQGDMPGASCHNMSQPIVSAILIGRLRAHYRSFWICVFDENSDCLIIVMSYYYKTCSPSTLTNTNTNPTLWNSFGLNRDFQRVLFSWGTSVDRRSNRGKKERNVGHAPILHGIRRHQVSSHCLTS